MKRWLVLLTLIAALVMVGTVQAGAWAGERYLGPSGSGYPTVLQTPANYWRSIEVVCYGNSHSAVGVGPFGGQVWPGTFQWFTGHGYNIAWVTYQSGTSWPAHAYLYASTD